MEWKDIKIGYRLDNYVLMDSPLIYQLVYNWPHPDLEILGTFYKSVSPKNTIAKAQSWAERKIAEHEWYQTPGRAGQLNFEHSIYGNSLSYNFSFSAWQVEDSEHRYIMAYDTIISMTNPIEAKLWASQLVWDDIKSQKGIKKRSFAGFWWEKHNDTFYTLFPRTGSHYCLYHYNGNPKWEIAYIGKSVDIFASETKNLSEEEAFKWANLKVKEHQEKLKVKKETTVPEDFVKLNKRDLLTACQNTNEAGRKLLEKLYPAEFGKEIEPHTGMVIQHKEDSFKFGILFGDNCTTRKFVIIYLDHPGWDYWETVKNNWKLTKNPPYIPVFVKDGMVTKS